MFDSLAEAIYRTVHDHPGGAVRLAPKVGMNAGTLSNKANPAMEEHKLGLLESVPIQRITDDFRILAAYAWALDHAVVPVGDFARCSDLELLDLYTRYHAEIGQTANSVREALAQPRVRAADVAKVRRELIEDMQAGMAFLARLEALAEG